MISQDYSRQIDEFERVLQEFETAISVGTISEDLPPVDLWGKAEAPVALIKDLAGNFKEAMLIMKPEKTPVIEQLFEATIQPLNAFEEALFRETTDPLAKSRLAFVQLRKAMVASSDFLNLAKEIRDEPSPIIQEILKLREVYAAKEYLAAVQAPEAFQTRLHRLIEHIEALNASLNSLERALDEVKECLSSFREESLKIRSAPIEASARGSEEVPITETKRQPPLS